MTCKETVFKYVSVSFFCSLSFIKKPVVQNNMSHTQKKMRIYNTCIHIIYAGFMCIKINYLKNLQKC